MVKVSIGLIGLERVLGGDFAGVPEIARQADEIGIDMVSITDHVVMGENIQNYPYGPFPMPLDYPWFEPLSVLSAIASVTKRIRLSTGILISPLRPAVLLAKQLATLDVMSRGPRHHRPGHRLAARGIRRVRHSVGHALRPVRRADRGLQAAVAPRPGRLPWQDGRFREIYSYPRPVQPTIPMWFGLKPTEKNFARIAKYGTGWIPMDRQPEVIAGHAETMRKAFIAAGREPEEMEIRVGVRPTVPPGKDRPDFNETLATVPALIAAGATTLEFIPSAWCKNPEELAPFFRKLVTWRDGLK